MIDKILVTVKCYGEAFVSWKSLIVCVNQNGELLESYGYCTGSIKAGHCCYVGLCQLKYHSNVQNYL